MKRSFLPMCSSDAVVDADAAVDAPGHALWHTRACIDRTRRDVVLATCRSRHGERRERTTDALKNLELLITSRYPIIVVDPGTGRWASHSPRATAASPSNDIVEIPSPRSKALSPAAVTGLSARNTVTCVGVAWPSAQSQR